MSISNTRPISISISALGGQGGAVLSQWIIDLAEANGFYGQSTSVPGVAQRTGATIYYIELFSKNAAVKAGKKPILALMPMPGDVDICIASELMEAGRAVERKFVSPSNTTLISSTHRVYAISEKEQPGDARADSGPVLDTIKKAAKTCIAFDMQAAADDTGSVISSIMFGALAGSDTLPFSREAFEETIRKTGRAVETNLRGFDKGFNGAQQSTDIKESEAETVTDLKSITKESWRQLSEYQDSDYADLYYTRVQKLGKNGVSGKALSEAARQLGLWMAFHDVSYVAGQKTRLGRGEDIRQEVKAAAGQITQPSEYFHPRWEEFCDLMPNTLGRWMEKSSLAKGLLGWAFDRDRLVKTNTLSGFIPLYLIAGMKRWRLRSYRYTRENQTIENWLDTLSQLGAGDHALAQEIAKLPRLIKGYGSTHKRGLSRFNTLIELAQADPRKAGLATTIQAAIQVALESPDPDAFKASLN